MADALCFESWLWCQHDRDAQGGSHPAGENPRMSNAQVDADLLALCAEFMAIDAIFWRHDETLDRFTDNEIADLSQKWDALVPRITAISAKTDQGRKAKAEVAYWVMRTTEAGEFQERNDLVRSALADVVGSVATAPNE
jgi:hypothetical protein